MTNPLYRIAFRLVIIEAWLTSPKRPKLVQQLGHAFRWLYESALGARRVKTGPYHETIGVVCENGIDIEFEGACPVRGEGEVDGHPCYYRSRGTGWSFEVYDRDGTTVIWDYCSGVVYHFPDGGWVHADVSRENIREAVKRFRKERNKWITLRNQSSSR